MKTTVQTYLDKNFPIIPVPYKSKSPIIPGWPSLKVDSANMGDWFPDGQASNIAVLLGVEGSWLVDLDIDCPEAKVFCDRFAPETGFIYGRKSNPNSHRIYKIKGALPACFKAPDGTMLIELRAGQQASLLPGSVHPSGEFYEYSKEGHPAEVDYEHLLLSTCRIAACALLARNWPQKGGRQKMALAVAGTLCKAGWTEEDISFSIFEMAKLAGDEEAAKRSQAAVDTVKKFQAGKAVVGISGLMDLVSDKTVQFLRKWLQISEAIDLEELIENMNRKYAVVIAGNSSRILREDINPFTKEKIIVFLKKAAFMTFFKNTKIQVGWNAKKDPIYKTHAEAWMENPDRRTYENIMFEPGKNLPSHIYNYWQGLSVEPIQNDDGCKLFFSHLHNVICSGDEEVFFWVVAWLADLVQNPGEKPGTAIVLRGPQGCGKSAFVNYFGRIFGPHFLQINAKKHLFGNFNAHQEDIVLLLGEEISLANDKKAIGTVKDLITSEYMMIERKGIDPVRGRNCLRLILTSNEEWVVPVDNDDRRFLVLDVSGHRAKDFVYFESLKKEEENGGPEALLHFLQNYKFAENLRHPPQTAAMVKQKIESLEPFAKALYQYLSDGHIHPKGMSWPNWIETSQFHSLVHQTLKFDGYQNKAQQTSFGIKLQKYLGPIKKAKKFLPEIEEETGVPYNTLQDTVQQTVYELPSLEECRKRFAQKTGIAFTELN